MPLPAPGFPIACRTRASLSPSRAAHSRPGGCRMRAQAHWTPWAWAALIVASTAVLLVPALYNGFPMLFPDTDTYLKVAYGHEWTLDRSGFYGFWLKPIVTPMSGTAGLWTAVFVQASLIAGILALVARHLVPRLTPVQCFVLISADALLFLL